MAREPTKPKSANVHLTNSVSPFCRKNVPVPLKGRTNNFFLYLNVILLHNVIRLDLYPQESSSIFFMFHLSLVQTYMLFSVPLVPINKDTFASVSLQDIPDRSR
ncbi:hypothetical protein TNCT_670901 [Trichonephila clavata]|uniref:Uncharacterized protein n=1 Tax=Trichonephila clavata TaxID=2740835 RepID=A0A8X6M584_TRICU|nr:hypothetical protein TNCT_670901 [Trichonephila clavata]